MQNAVKKAKKEAPPLLIPDPNPRCRRWLVLGLDPSLSRTGFALMDVRPALAHTPEEGPYTEAIWLAAGSLKPEIPEVPGLHVRSTLWQRSKAIATYLREIVKSVAPDTRDGKGDFHVCDLPECCKPEVGLIVASEYPTPGNDFLVSLNRIINLVFFEDGVLAEKFAEIRIMLINASTLRSLNGLVKRGNSNKVENMAKAYQFIDKARFPELDTDSCDAVLMAMMGRHAASAQLGVSSEIPDNFKTSLCSGAQDVKGKGRNQKVVTRGILHRTEYWYKYERIGFTVRVKDASNPKKSLSRINFSI
ncbi:MAG: hypothetical protein OK454_11615 [Thaumarchaeota archaeon]|nr:hypothetical protein [Nitrososphaerota archaeon]